MTDQLQQGRAIESDDNGDRKRARPTNFPVARSEGFHLAKRLTEYFSVVTAASFALSIIANQAVFNR